MHIWVYVSIDVNLLIFIFIRVFCIYFRVRLLMQHAH